MRLFIREIHKCGTTSFFSHDLHDFKVIYLQKNKLYIYQI